MGELSTYKKKRNFKETSEPSGKVTKRKKQIFVIQRHDASHLHWDFRLELDGVLKSWAVPKEPTMDPSIKRLAVQVEDHPIDYATFDGDIPEGNYGAGHVDIWDEGTWKCLDPNPSKALSAGKISFELKGKKMKGRFTLVKSHGTYGGNPGRNWLLIKANDALRLH